MLGVRLISIVSFRIINGLGLVSMGAISRMQMMISNRLWARFVRAVGCYITSTRAAEINGHINASYLHHKQNARVAVNK